MARDLDNKHPTTSHELHDWPCTGTGCNVKRYIMYNDVAHAAKYTAHCKHIGQ